MDATWNRPLTMRRRLAWQTAFLLAVLCAWRIATFKTPVLTGFDEVVYAYYAEVLEQDGIAGIRRLLHLWPDHAILQLGPLPFRILYIGAGCAVARLMNVDASLALALVACISGCLLILVGYALSRRWMRPSAAILSAVLLASSPLAAGLSRRGLQDTPVALLIVLTIWLFDRALVSRAWRDASLCGLVLWAGLLTKESMVFIYPVLVAVAIARRQHTAWRCQRPLVIGCILAPVAAALVMLAVAGSPGLLWRSYRAYGGMQRVIPYALQYQRGPWFRYLVDFTLLAPMTVMLAWCSLLQGRTGFKAGGGRLAATMLLTGAVVFSCLPLLNVRLVLFLDVPLRMLAVAGAGGLAAACVVDRRRRTRIVGGLVALAAALDVLTYRIAFLQSGIEDTITYELIKVLGFANEVL